MLCERSSTTAAAWRSSGDSIAFDDAETRPSIRTSPRRLSPVLSVRRADPGEPRSARRRLRPHDEHSAARREPAWRSSTNLRRRSELLQQVRLVGAQGAPGGRAAHFAPRRARPSHARPSDACCVAPMSRLSSPRTSSGGSGSSRCTSGTSSPRPVDEAHVIRDERARSGEHPLSLLISAFSALQGGREPS